MRAPLKPGTGRTERGSTPRSLCYCERGGGGRGRPVFAATAKGWRPVGYIEERGGVRVFVKRADSRRHRLHSPPAYALEEAVLTELAGAGVVVVEVAEVDTGRLLRAPLRAFAEQGVPVHRGGFEAQVALPLARWQVADPRQVALFGEGWDRMTRLGELFPSILSALTADREVHRA